MRVAALDLGSGTVKLSVFEQREGTWEALCLEEANTELRKGMGPDLRLQAGPLAATLSATAAFVTRARSFGVSTIPAYATSAVRKATNAQDLLGPLQRRLGVSTRILSIEEEGRLNLYGALARGLSSPLVLDPGGDSTELCGGEHWQTAPVASLPFGSVSLQERYGGSGDNGPITWKRLAQVIDYAREQVLGLPAAQAFLDQALCPSIRMNLPIQRALESVNGRVLAAHGAGGDYSYEELETLCRTLAGMDHAGRASLLAGEPLGKVDRTCYGFASWLGTLKALGGGTFKVEPWGIKLGAALFLSQSKPKGAPSAD